MTTDQTSLPQSCRPCPHIERLVKESGDEMQKLRRALRELVNWEMEILEGAACPKGSWWWHRFGPPDEHGGPYSTRLEAALASVESAQR